MNSQEEFALRTPLVTLASNINHSVYAAAALRDAGLLERYVSPVIASPDSRLLSISPKGFRRSRAFRECDGLEMDRLLGSELARRLLKASRLSVNSAAALHSRVLDFEIQMKMGSPGIFHFHTSGLLGAVRRAKRGGAITIADHRDVHPRDHEYIDPLTKALEIELEQSDFVIANSEASRASLANRGVNDAKICVIPLGVDTKAFTAGPSRRQSDLDAFNVLFVGKMSRRKGVDLLLQAFEELDESSFRLTLCGAPGEIPLEESSAAMPGITYLGPRTRSELVRIYQAADVLVLPSRIDAFGLVAIEAMACGTPAIVTDACGVADCIRGSGGGLVIEAGSATRIAMAIRQLSRVTANEREQLRRNALDCANNWSWSEYGLRLVNWYSDTVLPQRAEDIKRGYHK